jgi:excisionase family DNA binding protein
VTAAVVRQDSETYLPSVDDAREVADVHDFLAAHEAAGRGVVPQRYFLAGASVGDRVEIPEEIHRVLLKVVDALTHGLAVTVAPQSTTLTTQQAADLLGVTRPTVIKILNEGGMPFDRVGTHRRLLLGDVMSYREQRRAAQYAALEASSIELVNEGDLDTVLEDLREARRVTAARRRAANT